MGLLNAFYDSTTQHLTVTCLVCGATYGPVYVGEVDMDAEGLRTVLTHTATCPLVQVKEKEQN